MKSYTTARFRRAFDAMPEETRRRARAAYRHFRENPSHAGLHFKRVHPSRPVYSARVSRGIRAVGVLEGDAVVWFWIGAHNEYERIIAEA